MDFLTMEMDMGLETKPEGEFHQEASYNAASSRFRDLFADAFTSFNPDAIITGGNNRLATGMNSMDVELELGIGYKYTPPALTPNRPGRFGAGTAAGSDITPFSKFD